MTIRQKARGFTIVELLIATAVFSVVLLIAQTSFVQIGHLFYRGVSISQTQDAADHIYQDINGNFQTAAGVTFSVASPSGGYDYYCIGNTRYTYNINREVDSSAQPNYAPYNQSAHTGGNYGILKDVLKGTGKPCEVPCDTAAGNCTPNQTVPFNNPIELLGDKMRVEQFDICRATAANVYNVAIVLAYGDDNTLSYDSSLGPPSTLNCRPSKSYYSSVSCQGDSHNDFCAVSSVITAVYKG